MGQRKLTIETIKVCPNPRAEELNDRNRKEEKHEFLKERPKEEVDTGGQDGGTGSEVENGEESSQREWAFS